jgi:hypothetical protein
MEPENAQAHYYQGMIWAGGGNTTRARIALSTALNLKPNFQAAAQALDKLGKSNEPQTKEQTTSTYTRPKPSRSKLVVPLVLAVVLAGAGGVAMLVLSDQPAGATDLAKKLGTRLSLVSTSRVGSAGQDLHIDVGTSWGKLAQGDQAAEMHNIAKGAQAMGIVNVFVYAESQPVAETHGDAICVGDCVPHPIAKPASPNQPGKLSPAAAAEAQSHQLKGNKR